MTTRTAKTSPLVYARVAGFLYLIAIVSGVFSMMFVSNFVVPGDAVKTGHNILASESLFRLGFVGDLIGQMVFILLALVLYKLLKPVNKILALLMVILALIGIPIAMVNLALQSANLSFLSSADWDAEMAAKFSHAPLITDESIGTLVMPSLFFLEFGYITWGLSLLPLGYLVFKSGFLPRILGVLLIIACFGYLIDFVTLVQFPNFDATIKGFTRWGELLLPLWLLIKGVNIEQWEKRALESA